MGREGEIKNRRSGQTGSDKHPSGSCDVIQAEVIRVPVRENRKGVECEMRF